MSIYATGYFVHSQIIFLGRFAEVIDCDFAWLTELSKFLSTKQPVNILIILTAEYKFLSKVGTNQIKILFRFKNEKVFREYCKE